MIQEILSKAYNEFIEKDNWETKNYTLILIKGGYVLKDKKTGERIELKAEKKI